MLDPRIGKGMRLLGNPSHLRVFVKHRVVPSFEHRALPEKSYATVVDIGAHTGQFSLLVRARYPEATIYAFEPLPAAAAKFREVFEGDSRVNFEEAAIAPDSGEATLYAGSAWDNNSLRPGTDTVREITVRAGPLEDFLAADAIRQPALLKLDVQSYEREALVGCRSLLDRFDDVVVELMMVEDRPGQALASDVIALLLDEGFQLVGIDSFGQRNGRIHRFDGIFTRLGSAS
jgi:FkbM family methyltransferase